MNILKNLTTKKFNKVKKASFLGLFLAVLLFSPIVFSNHSFSLNHTSAGYTECRKKCIDKYGRSGRDYADCRHHCIQQENKPKEQTTAEKMLKGFVHIVFVLPMANFAAMGTEISGKILDPAILNKIFSDSDSDKALYNMWIFIRDILNLLFIFVLLFSAFATIFQVQKYHLLKSNILVMIIIMALLVNFSWPISRAVMDSGNVLMFYLLDELVVAPTDEPKGEYFFGALSDGTGLINIISLDGKDQQDLYDRATVTDQIVAGIFLMLFAITFFAIAAIFLIRIVVFIILLIFSPIGFAAAIFPGTRKFSDMWWDELLKWTFIGPFMVFMVYISTTFILEMQKLSTTVNGYGISGPPMVRNAIVYSAGIVMLWSGVLVAQQMGGAAGGFVVNKARNLRGMTTRFTKNVYKAGIGATFYGAKAGGRVLDNRLGNRVAKTIGSVQGAYKRVKDTVHTNPKESYERSRDLAHQKAQGGDIAASADKKDQLRYQKELKDAHLDTIIKKAGKDNKNENERKAAQKLLQQKDTIKTEKDLTRAFTVLSEDTKATATLLKNVSQDIFKDGNSDTYKNILATINTTSSPTNINKQTAQLRKQFAQNGRSDAVFDYYMSTGAGANIALNNSVSKINTSADMAKQTKLIKKINAGGRAGDAIKNHINTEFIKDPALRQDLIKNLSTEGLSSLRRTILQQEKRENALSKASSELEIVNGQLKTLSYVSPLTADDDHRKQALERRKNTLKSRIRTLSS